MKISMTHRWPLAAGLSFCVLAGSSLPGFAAQYGNASWYAMTSITANGERASPATMTAAHRTLKFGTQIRVTNLHNSQSVVLCINDRGPFVDSRIVDVTKAAARRLDFVQSGVAKVRLDVIGRESKRCT
jgi:rare lipoprotein A